MFVYMLALYVGYRSSEFVGSREREKTARERKEKSSTISLEHE